MIRYETGKTWYPLQCFQTNSRLCSEGGQECGLLQVGVHSSGRLRKLAFKPIARPLHDTQPAWHGFSHITSNITRHGWYLINT